MHHVRKTTIAVAAMLTIMAWSGSALANGEQVKSRASADQTTPSAGGYLEFIPGPTVGIESASGCNLDVCIYTTGTGRKTTGWKTTAYLNNYETACPKARFYYRPPSNPDNWVLIGTIGDGSICYIGPGIIVATATGPPFIPRIDPDGTQLCNKWAPNPPLAGAPCVKVKA